MKEQSGTEDLPTAYSNVWMKRTATAAFDAAADTLPSWLYLIKTLM